MRAKHLYLISLGIVILDQATKLAAIKHLPYGSSVPVINGLLHFTSVRNPGGAFGMLQSSTIPLTIVTLLTVVGIAVLIRRKAEMPGLMGISLAFLLGGAVGNLVDRLRFQHVIDFIDFRVWPVFNLADCAITVAVALLGYHLLSSERHRAETVGEVEK